MVKNGLSSRLPPDFPSFFLHGWFKVGFQPISDSTALISGRVFGLYWTGTNKKGAREPLFISQKRSDQNG